MHILGIEIKKPNSNDIFIVGVLFLLSILVSVSLAESMNAKAETVLAWAFAAGSGALLSSIGIRVKDGLKQILIIVTVSVISALVGHFMGVVFSGFL